MTERRFVNVGKDIFQYMKWWCGAGSEHCADVIAEALNMLCEENEQLQKEIDKLKHRHSLLHDVCIEAECDRDGYHKDVVSLEKENEQLKSTIMEMAYYIGILEERTFRFRLTCEK